LALVLLLVLPLLLVVLVSLLHLPILCLKTSADLIFALDGR